jgi:hypothetical protein
MDGRSVLDELSSLQTATKDPGIAGRLGEISAELTRLFEQTDAERSQLQAKINEQDALIQSLQSQLSLLNAKETTATPAALATSFKEVIDAVQQAALTATGPIATTMRGMDIELKSILHVEPDGKSILGFPSLPTLEAGFDPASLSTIRMSFGAVPVVVPQPAPPPPEPHN